MKNQNEQNKSEIRDNSKQVWARNRIHILDLRLGTGEGAKKERNRLNKILEVQQAE